MNVYPDGRCLFGAVAVSVDPALIKCSRTVMGWPCNREIADKETKEADGLRMNTVRVMHENKDLYASTSKEMGFTDIYYADFGTMEERLKEMKNPSVYAGEPELLALVHLIEQPIEVYQPDDSTVMFGEAFLKSARKVNLIYAPEKTENGEKVPAHYDLLHNELYPGISDFVALRAGKTTWYMAQVSDVDHEKMEVEVNYMKKSGHSFIFTEEKPSWIGMDQIIHLCTMPGIDNRQRYLFEKDDLEPINKIMRS